MSQPKPIPLSSLSPQDLNSLHQTLQGELQEFQHNYESLLSVQQIYLDNKEVITNLGSDQVKDKPMLVPLNQSVCSAPPASAAASDPQLYVDGVVENYDRVIIDIGANYFVSKVAKETTDG